MEMLIAMTLLALVASAVVLFVTAMSRFSTRNNEIVNRIRDEIDLREQFDQWFALLDCPNTAVQLNLGNTLVRVSTAGHSYSVRRLNSSLTEGGTLVFSFPEHIYNGVPEGEQLTEIEIPTVRSVYFSLEGDELSAFPDVIADEDSVFTFPIVTHVNPANYLCKVIYF